MKAMATKPLTAAMIANWISQRESSVLWPGVVVELGAREVEDRTSAVKGGMGG
jgi:hypothetical protein